ncbi:MAG: polymerase, sigma-24 subunit, subfamily [Labilithrix sp.]|nr:polymerase, sigma-24 subunit, subfamily [Labilithrix sp.]
MAVAARYLLPETEMSGRSLTAASTRLRVVPPPAAPPRPEPRLPASTLDDSQLVTAMREGLPEAATAVHDRLRPVVERAVRRLLGPGDRDHEDLVQHAMIEVICTIDRFRGECPLDAWASTVAAHAVYNHIRKMTAERRLFEGFRGGDEEPPSAVARSLPHATSARSTLRRVFVHLGAMDPAKAWAYVLHDVCGYDLREVAEITDATIAAAQTRLVRGRRELHERLAADPELSDLLVAGEPRSGGNR